MTTLISALLTVAVPAQPAVTTGAVKSAHELRDAIHTALTAEARADARVEHLQAVAAIVRLYGELKENPHVAYRERVRLRAKLRSRLRRVASDMKRDWENSNSAKQDPDIAAVRGAAGGQAQRDPGQALVEMIESTIRSETWAARGGKGTIAVHPSGPAGGGAGVVGRGGFGGAIGGGGGVNGAAAQAESLIELIQTTVRPESWEVNGGRGTIMYWPGS
jgi:hypothetical protein